MKKIFSFVLLIAMILSLCACDGATNSGPSFQVGYGKANITPE